MISSPHNPAIKRVRALRSRKEREETGLFFAEGIRIVAEAAAIGAEIETMVLAPDLLTSAFAIDLAETMRRKGVSTLEVTRRVFESISGKEGPQGIAAVIRQRLTAIDRIDPTEGLCWVALEGVSDPGNLGTILRTCDAVGAAGVILLGATTDPFDPTVVRGSMGALFTQQVARTDIADLGRWKDKHGAHVIGTSDAADLDYRRVEYRKPVVLLMGSERHGLSAEAFDLCDSLVRIPMAGRSDSLNLAVATGVMLYELYNREHPADPIT